MSEFGAKKYVVRGTSPNFFNTHPPMTCCRSNTLADVSRHPSRSYCTGEHITRRYPKQRQRHRSKLEADESRSADCEHARRSDGRCGKPDGSRRCAVTRS